MMDTVGLRDHAILRCRSSDTLRLRTYLDRAGLAAWTPSYHRRVRLFHRRRIEEIEEPALASYVFVAVFDIGAAHRVGLRAGCPAFRAMRHAGRYDTVWDRELEPLREWARTAEAESAEALPVGTRAVVTEGPLRDYIVDVIAANRGSNVVQELGSRLRISVPGWMLRKVG